MITIINLVSKLVTLSGVSLLASCVLLVVLAPYQSAFALTVELIFNGICVLLTFRIYDDTYQKFCWCCICKFEIIKPVPESIEIDIQIQTSCCKHIPQNEDSSFGLNFQETTTETNVDLQNTVTSPSDKHITLNDTANEDA